jgi:hypothetical protein
MIPLNLVVTAAGWRAAGEAITRHSLLRLTFETGKPCNSSGASASWDCERLFQLFENLF